MLPDVPRETENKSTPESMRRAVRAARSHDPDEARLARMRSALLSAMDADVRDQPDELLRPRQSAVVQSPRVLRIFGVVGVVGALVVATWGLGRPADRLPKLPPAQALRATMARQPAISAPGAPVLHDKAHAPAETVVRSTQTRIRTSPRGVAPLSTPLVASPVDEFRLLQSAYRALDRSALDALAVIDELERVYPEGRFVQEREVIAIDALMRRGDDTAARARAERFMARFTASSHGPRITRWLEELGTPGEP